jgi:CubicO group peptidase (beta-lactamase class C family)
MTAEESVIHVDHLFEFQVGSPYQQVAPLFGAWAERAWAGPDWTPRFLVPDPPQDREGMVFLLPREGSTSVWVNTAFDLEKGIIQYVYVLPEVQAVVIDIQLSRPEKNATAVKVRYRRTALDPRCNGRIQELGQLDASSGPIWAAGIESCLKAG